MKRTRQIYDAFMRAIKEGSVPFGYYGPETCRWATPDEMRRFGLKDCPMVHLDEMGKLTAKLRGKGRISQDRHSGSYGGQQ